MSSRTITVHPNPLWRSKADYVAFAVVAEDYDGTPWYEQIVGRSVGQDRMEICCIPMAARDLSLGDTVQLVHRDEGIFIDAVVARSDWYSYRAMVEAHDESDLAALLQKLIGEGIAYEMGPGRLMGLAAQGEAHATRLVAALERCEAEGRLEWESAAS